MTPLAIRQLHALPKCLRSLTQILACSLVVAAAQNLPSSRPPQSPSDSGMRLHGQRRPEPQLPLRTPQGRAIPPNRQGVPLDKSEGSVKA